MASAIIPADIKRYEVTEVFSHPDAKVDIVLVHGLNGNPRSTWTAPNGVFWPSQLLPASLKSFQARILVYGYNADVYTFGSAKGGPSSDMIHQHAQTLLANLALERKSEEVAEHPIIWVAHSLGGILVKRALELSFDLQGNHDDDLRSIFVSTFGVIFLGTPHTGADAAKWGLILQGMVNAMVPKKLFETHSQLIKTLQSNNEILQNINLRFLDLYPNRLRICMVHEGHPTDLKGTKHLIVDQIAASPQLPDVQYFGIEATHSGMCKFESKNAPGFTNVSVTLRSWVQECPVFIQTRWDAERFLRKQKRKDEIAQLQRLSGLIPGTLHMTSPPDTPEPGSIHSSMVIAKSPLSIAPEDPIQDTPYLIKPSGFRPNSLFVGREAELEQMHKMLFDKKRRADGTSAVLLQSLPGGGKTHLARQYVYNHKDDFPGGIFWLRAKSETELAAGFWDIARKAALHHPVGTEETGSLEDPEQFINMVRKWLDNRHEWLIVLDGINFTHSALRKFIPDSTNTSLIYTSTEKSVIGDHHFMNPQLIKLPLLSARGAQRLLLLELGRVEPFAKDDLRYSMELVQAMGFLPVVIHAVAQRLKTTDEPLSKFARTYSSEPRLRGLGTYIAVVEQLKGLGAKEVLNLINIVCFFSQHIPVEMISLGLKALPQNVSVKAYELVSGCSLNNTFKILNTFALIERNESNERDHNQEPDHTTSAVNRNGTSRDQDNTTPSSHSQTSNSHGMLAENIDVIRLHSVVQGFFVDTLSADGSLPFYLDLAIRLFCCSYDMANTRISLKPHDGLVEDYRLYEIHGNKLSEHLVRHLSKRLSAAQKEVLGETDDMLARRLVSIRTEIGRRTPESSSVLVAAAGGGRGMGFPSSIFDRTSSSSDTGPETPMKFDRVALEMGLSAWGIEAGRPHFESPVPEGKVDENGQPPFLFPLPLLMPEDPGYESDREEVANFSIRIPTSSPALSSDIYAYASPKSPREVAQPRQPHPRPRPRPRPVPNTLYRTVPLATAKGLGLGLGLGKGMGYRTEQLDSRSVSASAITPRVTQDHAQGFLQSGEIGPSGARAQSRGRIPGTGVKGNPRLSGQSGAEVSLAHLRQKSPLSPRGGGRIVDRSGSRSRRGSELKGVESGSSRGGMMLMGRESYSAAIAGPTREWKGSGVDDRREEDWEGQGQILTSLPAGVKLQRPHLSAMESLQRIPIHPADDTSEQRPVIMPPYPLSPGVEPAPTSRKNDNEYFTKFTPDSVFNQKQRQGEEDDHTQQQGYGKDQESIYPRREGLPPIELCSQLSPKTINQPYFRAYPERETKSESLPASLLLSHSHFESDGVRLHDSTSETNLMSYSYPGLRVHDHNQRQMWRSDATSTAPGSGDIMGAYVPGRPEFEGLDLDLERSENAAGRGYSSQPMTREVSRLSGRSANDSWTGTRRGWGGRKGSVAETEPIPRRREGVFEPRDGGGEGSYGRGNGNSLEFARAALIERLDDWGVENSPPNQFPTQNPQQQPQNKQNPHSQSQYPRRPSSNPAAPNSSPSVSLTQSQTLPPKPSNSLMTTPNTSLYPSPIPPYYTTAAPPSTTGTANSFGSYASPCPPDNTPNSIFRGAGSFVAGASPRTSPPQQYLSPKLNSSSTPRTSPSQPFPTQISPRISPYNSQPPGGERMDRKSSGSGSGSGGVRIPSARGRGGEESRGMERMIAFGDSPEPVDYVLARERVLRSWRERERVERTRREEGRVVGLGIGVEGDGEGEGEGEGSKGR